MLYTDVYSESVFHMSRSHIYNNSGGIIYLLNTNELIVTDSYFIGNTATENKQVLISVINADITMINCLCKENVYNSDGGVILSVGESTIHISESYFFKNQITGSGGVIATLMSGNTTIVNSNFSQNRAGDKGGVILDLSQSGYLKVINSCFIGNKAASLGAVLFSQGLGKAIFDSCYFSENEAFNDGGLYFKDIEVLYMANTSLEKTIHYTYCLCVIKFENSMNHKTVTYKTKNTKFISRNTSIISSEKKFMSKAMAKGFIVSVSTFKISMDHEETIFASGKFIHLI